VSEFEEPLAEVTDAPNQAIFDRDGNRCVRCGGRPNTTQHRIHGNRADRRPSNLLSMCMGPGTKDCHSWAESHRRDARTMGWEVSRHGRRDATLRVSAWMEWGPYGRGWYRLDDAGGLTLVEAG